MFLVWDSPRGRVVKELTRAVAIVGRDAVSDVRIDDPTVSARHALVQVEGGRVRITDLGSTSGTRINGARLTPELPSTLEPGDFVHVGKAVLSFHRAPPPAPPRAKARPPPPPPRRRVPERLVVGGAVVLVIAAGALLAVLLPRGGTEVRETAVTEPPPGPVRPGAPPEREPEPEPEPPPPVEAGPERAPVDTLPPQRFVPKDRFPDLLEVDREAYYPVRLRDWDGIRVEALGADGRVYSIARGRVTKIEDRGDLERRAALSRRELDPEEVPGRLQLARWCARRFVASEARVLAEEVLKLKPGDAEAKALLQAAGENG